MSIKSLFVEKQETREESRKHSRRGSGRVFFAALFVVLLAFTGSVNAQAAAPSRGPISSTDSLVPGNSQAKNYGVSGSVGGALFYTSLNLNLKTGGSKDFRFSGQSLGFFGIGGSYLAGTLSTGDLDALVKNTKSFDLYLFPTTGLITFKDSSGHQLGIATVGNVGTLFGSGPGSGTWQ